MTVTAPIARPSGLLTGLLIGIGLCTVIAATDAPPLVQPLEHWSGPSQPFALETGQFGRTDAEVLYIWDHQARKLAVYAVDTQSLNLLHTRDCSYDFQPTEFTKKPRKASPSVKEMKEEVTKLLKKKQP